MTLGYLSQSAFFILSLYYDINPGCTIWIFCTTKNAFLRTKSVWWDKSFKTKSDTAVAIIWFITFDKAVKQITT